jgi:hypothetical protein
MAATEVLRYPNDVTKFNKWLRFDVRQGRHVGRGVVTTEATTPDKVVMSAAMYLPTSALRSSMTVGYDTTEFSGMLMERAAQAAQDLMGGQLGKNAEAAAGNAVGDFFSGIGKLFSGANFETLGEWGKSALYNASTAALGTQVEAMTGQKVNPRTDIIFSAQDYRDWTFEYILIPRTRQEAEDIESIVNMFRFYMLPVYRSADTKLGASGAYMMGYPYEWTIGIYGAEAFSDDTFKLGTDLQHGGNLITNGSQSIKANKIGRSVLKQLAVDQAGGGKVAFVGESGKQELYPLVTTLTLTFQEVILLGRDQPELVGGTPRGGDPRNA